ncbi:unnamed protein product [Phytomonas sp. EM1]|nr:unnamed protein product [Phytomonas sp. EM1]|eukprot:CCW65497.1 unnamed protein product [Phytomonas sp. isolate EM1]
MTKNLKTTTTLLVCSPLGRNPEFHSLFRSRTMKLEVPPSHHIPHLLTKLKTTPRRIVTPPVNHRERFPRPSYAASSGSSALQGSFSPAREYPRTRPRLPRAAATQVDATHEDECLEEPPNKRPRTSDTQHGRMCVTERLVTNCTELVCPSCHRVFSGYSTLVTYSN